MSSLPDPKEFTGHKATYIASRPKESNKSYDLQNIHNIFIEARGKIPVEVLVEQGNKLIDYNFYKTTPYPAAAKDLFGYSDKDQSFSIHLKDKDGSVKAIAVRSSLDKDGQPVKWKTYGSKKFIPYEIEDDFVFLFSGMGELVIMKMLGLSYVMLQADGMVRHIPLELEELCKEKTIIVLQDNDSSFRKIVPEIQRHFKRSEVLVIDFERVLDRELKHGYDFRDFCNEIKDAKQVMERLEIEIVCLQDKTHVR